MKKTFFCIFVVIVNIISSYLFICAYPTKMTAMAMPFYDLQPQKIVFRSSFSTNYSSSDSARKHNIALCVKSINKTFIDVNAEFSFNKTVGARNAKNGYQNAKIIKDGKFVDGIGGGVCQVATTLYNALLLSNLRITEYHPHSLAVKYVEPSFDAMVGYGYADLKAVNNTHNPIIIYAKADENNVTVSIFGEPLKVKVLRKSVIIGEIPVPPDTIIQDTKNEYPDLLENETKIISYGKTGLKSEGYLTKTLNGKVIYSKKIRHDTYAAISRIIIVGTKKTKRK